jgi:hypothetical protein
MGQIHEVAQGECLSSIALKYRISNWKTIYDHPENAAFKKKRPNPNLIAPGDQIFIPDAELREQSCPTNSKHTFRLKKPKTFLSLVVEDEMGRALANRKYKLVVGDDVFEGSTNGSGLIERPIPADATSGVLTVESAGGGYTWNLDIGHLDPHEEISGVQARLHNLGFYTGAIDGDMGPETREALKAFQFASKLPVTGELNDATRSKLSSTHDRE